MILNRCRGCGCPLDPGERYCEECEEEMMELQKEATCKIRAAGKSENNKREGKCE